MRISSDGQVLIPEDIQQELGLLPNTEIELIVDGESLRIVKATAPDQSEADTLEVATVTLSADAILALARDSTKRSE